MNSKKARQLRKLAGYHPTDVRTYETLKLYSAMGRVREVKTTNVNAEKSTRGIYREMKRLA